LNISEAPRPQGGASRKGNFVHIVALDPTYKVGLAGHVPVKTQSSKLKTEFFLVKRYPKMRMDAKEKSEKTAVQTLRSYCLNQRGRDLLKKHVEGREIVKAE
jgi:hypothetical protein